MLKSIKTPHILPVLGALLLLAIILINSGNRPLAGIVPAFDSRTQLASVLDTDPGLVGWWTFDSISGATVTDSSAAGNNATLVGSPSTVTGQIGQAISLDGSTQYMTTSGVALPTDVTLSLWMKGTAGLNMIMSSDALVLGVYNGFPTISFNTCLSCGISGTAKVNDGNWHHIVVTVSNNTAAIYVDGSSAGGGSLTYAGSSSAFGIGMVPTDGFFTGSMDDIRIFNRALSAAEISQFYSVGQATGSYTLTVSDVGSGTVTGTGISCGTTCSAPVAFGTPLALTAVPASGFTFGGWTGACSGTGACNATVSGNTSVTATFNQIPPINALGLAYVRTDGSDACSGVVDAPAASAPNCAFRTIQKAINTAINPGNIITIHGGDYTGQGQLTTVASGSSGSYITIQAFPGEHPIIARILVGQDYIKIIGLDIALPQNYSSTASGIQSGGSYGQFLNNHIYGGTTGNPGATAIFLNGAYNLVQGNLIEGSLNVTSGYHTGGTGDSVLTDNTKNWAPNSLVGLPLNSGGVSWIQGTITSNTSNTVTGNFTGGTFSTNMKYVIGNSFWIPFVASGHDNKFINNTIKNLIDVERVWDSMGDNTLVSGNEVSNMKWSGADSGVHPDIFQVVGSNTPSHNVIVENNYFHDLDSQIGINESSNSSNWIFRNNVFANITQRSMLQVIGSKIYNNTFFNVQAGDQNMLDGWGPGVEYKNNIIIGGSTNPGYGMINFGTMGTFTKCADEGGTCTFTGTKDLIYQNTGGTVGTVWKHGVTGPQICNAANFGSDPNQYYAKSCYMKDSSEIPISNNYYGIPGTYAPRLETNILNYGDIHYINGGDPGFVAAYTNCLVNSCDFSLRSGSPLMNAGVNLSSTWSNATDKTGKMRPSGSAWDIGAYQSCTSNCGGAIITQPSQPDTTPPTLTSIASAPSLASAGITWSTSELATSQVLYGLTTTYGSQSPLNAALSQSHSQTIALLQPNTVYHYQVISKDAAGNSSVSADMTFTTLAPSIPLPTISFTASLPTINQSQSSTLTWSSINAATCAMSSLPLLKGNLGSAWKGGALSGTAAFDSTALVSISATDPISTALTISCTGAGGTAAKSVTVTVTPPPDTTAPVISISSPAAGTVSNLVSLSASASDNVGVIGVQFKVDGNNLGAELFVAPYSGSWNTAGISNGSHVITAVARDLAGNVTASDPVTVTVANVVVPTDTTPPTVSLTSPVSGSTISGTVPITATASDDTGVVGVQFKVDGNSLGAELFVAPYSGSWNTAGISNGSHTVTAVARDLAGHTTTASVSVTVANAAPPAAPSIPLYIPPAPFVPTVVQPLVSPKTTFIPTVKQPVYSPAVTRHQAAVKASHTAVLASAPIPVPEETEPLPPFEPFSVTSYVIDSAHGFWGGVLEGVETAWSRILRGAGRMAGKQADN